MATVAQLVEHSVVIRVVAGSSPVGRPTFLLKNLLISKIQQIFSFKTLKIFNGTVNVFIVQWYLILYEFFDIKSLAGPMVKE